MAVVNTRRGAVPPFRCLPPGRGCAGGAGARSVDSSPAERREARDPVPRRGSRDDMAQWIAAVRARALRSEEHTSELQSRLHLVCRLLLEKKKKRKQKKTYMKC